jgi:hypothetical protein
MELSMQPFSYISLKIVHDQNVKEAQEQRPYAEQEMQRQGLLQTFGTFLARFNNRNKKGPLPGCAETSPGSC